MAQKFAGAVGMKLDDTSNVELLHAYVNSAILAKMMDETPNMTSAKKNFKQIAGLPVNIVETIDNGLTLFSTLLAGSNQDMHPRDASRVIWETMLLANFRGGHDQPMMYKRAMARPFTMFQMTPHKLWEYRGNLLSRAVHGEVDQFGTPYAVVVARYLMLFGFAEWLFRSLFNSSIVDQATHTPYASHVVEPVKGGYSFHAPKLATSPLVDWAQQAKRKGVAQATKEHFSYWGQLTKAAMTAQGKYPKQWYNNPWLFQAGIKKVHRSPRAVSRRR